ncbi:MAG: acetyl-CoA carboxylase biotin carboxyl carrier protein [Xanthomonadales bacterium]|nr:acetyl-CoA carboxylase biotin carboxyl carrier protein [Xanthomonadales bacterium]
MDIRKIKKLVELLEESGLAEIEISENDESVRLSRYPQQMPAAPAPYPAAMAPPVMPVAGPAPAAPQAEGDPGGDAEPEVIDGTVVRSPMVGTFYSSPNPESDPFVRVGQEIKAGDVVCIIEAMKMFNQIETEVDGKVVSVLVENAQPVEFDQPLFIVR